MAVVRRVIDAVEVHEVGAVGQHGQRFDLATVGQAAAVVAVEFGGDIAGLHDDHAHAGLAVQFFRGDRQRRDVAFVPVEDEELFGAVSGGRFAGLDNHALISIGRQRDGALERHVHGRHAKRRRRQQQSVHAQCHRMADDLTGVDVGAGGQMRAVLLDAAGGQDDQRIFFHLLGDFGLREIDEVAGW